MAEFGPDRSLVAELDEAVASGADALAVAGGDGSLAAVAQAALTHDLPFVCVPAGTRNHFARDLGLDATDWTTALDALADGVEGRVDVGEVNGRAFLNNVSLGIYAEAIRHAGYRDAKVRTLLETARPVLGPAEASGLQVTDDLGVTHVDPAVVLVSNNPYAFGGPLARGARPTLRSGRLGIIVIDRPAGARRPAGRPWSASSLRVEGRNTVHAGIDGEALEMTPPLEFAVRPAALRLWSVPLSRGRWPRSARRGRPGQ